MKFVLVNGRTPRTRSFCALCCKSIGESYLRDIVAQLTYCNHECYVDHCKVPPISCDGFMITPPDACKTSERSCQGAVHT
jgi:hypothetical protein